MLYFHPISFRLSCGLNDLGRNDDLLLNDDEAGIVVVLVAVVCARVDGYQLALSKTVQALGTDLVRSQNHRDTIELQEFLNACHTEFGDVINIHGISVIVWCLL